MPGGLDFFKNLVNEELAGIPLKQGLMPLFDLAYLTGESLHFAHGTKDGVHPVNTAVLEQLLHTDSIS